MSVTIAELAHEIYVENGRGANFLSDEERARVTDGLRPRKAPPQEGLHTFTPEELLTLHVQTVTVNGNVTGYQRDADARHARKVARAMLDGKPMPEIQVAVDGKGRMSIVDGQHRALAGVIARLPVTGIVKRMDKQTQAELFFGQRSAKTVDPNVLVLAGTSSYARYVQDALEGNRHPWNSIVSANRQSKTRISPYAMFQLIIRYVANTDTGGAKLSPQVEEKWDRGLADELAPLIACFGNKQTNPLAFRPFAVQAIGATAMWVFRRSPSHPDDCERWQRHMPTFAWDEWLHIRTQRFMVGHLIDHWNKRLSAERRVTR